MPDILQSVSAMFDGLDLPKMALYIGEVATASLEVGTEIYISAPDANDNQKREFRLLTVFNEPGVIEGKAILETIQHLSDAVESVVASFKPCLN